MAFRPSTLLCPIKISENIICQTKSGAVGFIDRLDPLSWLIKVKLVVEAGQIRARLLDNAFREWRKLCSGNRPAGRLFCPSIMGVGDNLHVVGMALSVELECTFHGHAMNPFRMLHELCKHHSTSDVSGLKCIRSPDGIAVCRVRMGWPELHRNDHKQSYDRLSTHGSNEKEISHGRVSWQTL
jgi:hypothetical protein